MSFACSNLFLALGLMIALIGAGADYIMPGASPVWSPLRILLIVAGACLAIGACWLRRQDVPTWLTRARRGSPLRTIAITLITLLVLEFILTAAGAPTYYPADSSEALITYAPWWTCDEAGCHYVYDAVRQACENGELAGRPCQVNRQGFPDAEDFVMTDTVGAETRVLVLGDSFAFGMHADSGQSFVETLEAMRPASRIWNAAIPGTGTAQAVASFAAFGPLLRPRLTVLAFYVNDFDDNLLPLDSWLNAVDADGMAINVRKYSVGEGEKVIEFDLRAIRLLTVYGKAPPHNEMAYRLGLTRLGTLALQLIDRLQALSSAPERLDRRLELTRGFLRDLRQRASEQDSTLLALLIPAPEDVENAGRRYHLAVQLMEELGIPYVDLRGLLDRDADYHPAPDFHWNNAGHQKVGALLSDCVDKFAAKGDLADCSHVVLP